MRKKKNRVVNLRKAKTTDDMASESGDSETSEVAVSEPIIPTRIPEEPEDNIITPPRSPRSPSGKVRFRTSSIDLGDSPRKTRLSTPSRPALNLSSKTVPEQAILDPAPTIEKDEPSVPIYSRDRRPSLKKSQYPVEKAPAIHLTPAPVFSSEPASGGIIEQAWVLKMAGEIARRAHDEKAAREGFWSNSSQSADEREDTPPPAYQAKAL